MSKIKDFYEGLKKSTKITVLSCGSFVVMTMLILAFFIIFPITPSEKIMTNIGRENMARDNGQQTVQSGIPTVETTASTAATTKTTTTARSTVSRPHTSFTITITTGSGFLWNGRIPTGGIPGYTETVTTAVATGEPGTAPGNPNVDPTGITDPNQGGTEPDPNQGGVTPDPNQGGDDPDPNQGGVTPDPNQGGADPAPNQGGTPTPSVNPDPNQGGGAETW